ncbi:hypothetical protein CAPTEDRAFT_204896 [Capitella teleta]|uniref:Fibronectin type-III domain-containing protein n=1 Tax=Capitella teleta TaxID=283909 RepID=R7UB33_CAPTE|nr:hypothetical protein CAPTEDRAFT_204896 [Capitella teleta]|eukprot:ELU00452.1 hypothetical protein CAPTEDRAFT_204896 [Capitella teleta]
MGYYIILYCLLCTTPLFEACGVGFYGVECEQECGTCKNNVCFSVDGRCLDGCQLWFVGDYCREELRKPTLEGTFPLLIQLNESAVIITWTQDIQIPRNQSRFYGYTVAYAKGLSDFKDGPSVSHNPSAMLQYLIVSNIHATTEYYFHVRVYRSMENETRYGLSSNSIPIRITPGEKRTRPFQTTILNQLDQQWVLVSSGSQVEKNRDNRGSQYRRTELYCTGVTSCRDHRLRKIETTEDLNTEELNFIAQGSPAVVSNCQQTSLVERKRVESW